MITSSVLAVACVFGGLQRRSSLDDPTVRKAYDVASNDIIRIPDLLLRGKDREAEVVYARCESVLKVYFSLGNFRAMTELAGGDIQSARRSLKEYVSERGVRAESGAAELTILGWLCLLSEKDRDLSEHKRYIRQFLDSRPKRFDDYYRKIETTEAMNQIFLSLAVSNKAESNYVFCNHYLGLAEARLRGAKLPSDLVSYLKVDSSRLEQNTKKNEMSDCSFLPLVELRDLGRTAWMFPAFRGL